MSQGSYPEAQSSHLQAQLDGVIVITSGSPDGSLAENLREEIRHSGWDCEIVLGDISDPNHIRKLIHDVLDCFHCANVSLNNTEIGRDLFIGKVTDEEWLAQ